MHVRVCVVLIKETSYGERIQNLDKAVANENRKLYISKYQIIKFKSLCSQQFTLRRRQK